MPKIFISYRREDASYPAHALYEKMQSHFGSGSVFIDVDRIPVGVDFRRHLSEEIGRCDVLLVVIGDHWLDARHRAGPLAGQRRLDDSEDFVRAEIEAALARNIPVVPVLTGRSGMPDVEELPQSLAALCYRQAIEVRAGADFLADVHRLICSLQEQLGDPPSHPECRDRPKIGRQLQSETSPRDRVARLPGLSLERTLGKDGSAERFLALDQRSGRRVEIIATGPNCFETHEEYRTFLRRALEMRSLDHPGIVRVCEVIEDGDQCFIVQAWADGRPLQDMLTSPASEKQSLQRKRELLIQIAETLSHAHAHRLVHGRLTPQRIVIDSDGRPRIQFILASSFIGTPTYFSPEQLRGDANPIDGRTDVWAMGLIAYEILVGRPFAMGPTLRVVEAILKHHPAPLRQLNPEIPPELESICLRCLAKNPSDRFASAADLADALRHCRISSGAKCWWWPWSCT